MFFKLRFTLYEMRQTLLGFIGRLGKVYFVSTDVAHLFRETRQQAESISNCKMVEVLPDCPDSLAHAGVIEKSALINLLRHRMNVDRNIVADIVFDCLEYTNVQCTGREGDIVLLEECGLFEGKSFDQWIEDFKD